MRLLFTGLGGAIACALAVFVGGLFGVRSSLIVLVVIAPLIEEVCKATVCVVARRNAIVPAPWTLAEAIALGLGFGVAEAVLKWSPGLSGADILMRSPTVIMHAFVAVLLVAELNNAPKHNAERGFVTALFWHALYNAYIVTAAELSLFGLIEPVVRLIVMVALLRFAAPLFHRTKNEAG